MTMRDQVVAEALTWLGTPFHHGAQIKGVGVDCAHLLRAVYVGAGAVDQFTIEPYPPDWFMHREQELFIGYLERAGAVRVDDPLPGDAVVYRYGRCFAHGGVVAVWPRFVHAFWRSQRVELVDHGWGELRGREHLFFRVIP